MDRAHRWTDEQIEALERRMSREYGTAVREMRTKLDKFLAKYEEGLAKRTAKLDGTPEARKALEAWERDQAMDRRYLEGMVESLSRDATEATQRAMALVEDRLPSIYAENANWAAFEVDRAARLDTRFDLQDESTVRELMGRGERLFEPPRPNAAKVRAWTEQKLTAAVTQGILQGESIPHIAQRMAEVYGSDRAAAVRAARTACTGAENAGRVSSYERAEEMGIEMRQEWMATLDERTRETHVLLDGERVEVGDPFVTANGDELRFPGDPQGPPEEVYNCRCTLVAAIDGIDQSAAARFDRLPDDMSYEDWKQRARDRMEGKATGEPDVIRASDHQVVEGKDILGTWERRPDQFDFEIEDVLDAQGFDGLPRVVDADEFDRAVRQANGGEGLIMQRTYSAPTQEVLDSYRDMLYEGKWYVDCSTGGAQYGQGMYAAADYTGRLSAGIESEMQHYIDLGRQRNPITTFDMLTDARKSEMVDESIKSLGLSGEKAEAAKTMMNYELKIGKFDFNEDWGKLSAAHEKLMDVDYMSEVARLRTYRSEPVHYVETMTLDPSARIVKFDDISGLKDGMGERIFLESVKDASQDEMLIIKKEITHTATDEEWGAAKDLEDRIGLQEAKRVVDKYKGAYRDAMDAADRYRSMDPGSFAAAMGYDAINAVGHGASGSYTVVLNRTKLTIRRP